MFDRYTAPVLLAIMAVITAIILALALEVKFRGDDLESCQAALQSRDSCPPPTGCELEDDGQGVFTIRAIDCSSVCGKIEESRHPPSWRELCD